MLQRYNKINDAIISSDQVASFLNVFSGNIDLLSFWRYNESFVQVFFQ